jgi:hypothetical protein
MKRRAHVPGINRRTPGWRSGSPRPHPGAHDRRWKRHRPPPRGQHTFANPGEEPAIILNTFTPDLYVGYFRDLGELAASDEMTPEAILRVMARYATYPAGTPAPDTTD